MIVIMNGYNFKAYTLFFRTLSSRTLSFRTLSFKALSFKTMSFKTLSFRALSGVGCPRLDSKFSHLSHLECSDGNTLFRILHFQPTKKSEFQFA